MISLNGSSGGFGYGGSGYNDGRGGGFGCGCGDVSGYDVGNNNRGYGSYGDSNGRPAPSLTPEAP